MIRNYFKTAWRNLRRNKTYNVIKIKIAISPVISVTVNPVKSLRAV